MRQLLLLLLALNASVASAAPENETPLAQATRLEAELAAAGPDALDVATDHLRADLAEVLIAHLRRPGDAEATVDLIEPVLARTDPADLAFVGRLHHIFAQAKLAQGDAELAGQHYDDALAALTAAHGADDHRTLLARLGRAVFYSRTGRPAEADAESIAIVTTFQDTAPNSPAALQAYGQRGVFLLRLGRFAEAEALFRDLLDRDESARVLSYSERRAHLNNLAYLLNRAGRHAECAAIMEQLVAGDVAAFGRESATVLMARFNLAYVYGDLGRYDDAANLLHEDLELVEPRGSIGSFTPADYRGRLGEMALKQNRPAAAVPDLAAAVALLDATAPAGSVHQEDATLLRLRTSLALAQSASGDNPAAAATLVTALDHAEERFRQRLAFTSEKDRLAFAARERPLDLPATLDDPDLLARAVLRFKGLVLDSLLEDQQLALASTDPAVASLLADYQAALADTEANRADPLLGSRREQLERELARRTLTAASHRRALTTDPAAVLAALPVDTALVEYVHYRDLTPGKEPTDSYLALIGTTNAGWRVVRLGSATEIEAALARYRILVRRGGDLDWARAVRALVFDPVRAALPPPVDRLLIAPDGPLHQVAFASLPEADDHFVLEQLRIQLLNTGRDLLEPAAATRPAAGADLGVRILADPADTPRADLPALPGARAEGIALADRLQNTDLHLGADASPAALIAPPAPDVLHLACHAVVASDPALDAATRLRQTGLVLSGPDGFLSAAHIAALDLSRTRLVFLSACDSGGGETISGEGVFGLRRAFARARSPDLVMTLWPVADDSARALITGFYDALGQHQPSGEAFVLAQRQSVAAARAAQVPPLEVLRSLGAYTLSGAH